jgi:hypothetical protein
MVERGEGIVMRLDRAEEVRRQLQGLADALGESAEELARELGGEAPPDRRATPDAIRAEEPKASAATETAATEAEPEAPTASAAEIADDPTVGELAEEAAVEEPAEDEPDADDEPAVVELVPDEAAERSAREPDEQLSARLVALQMAVAGGKRDEVESHLKRTFDLDDVGQILDDVFGDGADGERAGWPSGGGAA